MSQQIRDIQILGAHKVIIEGPDLLHVQCIGEMSASDVRLLTAFAEAHIEPLAGSYMIVDLRKARGLPNDARRLLTDWLRVHHLAAIVNYGAGTIARAFSSLAIRALRVLYGQEVENVFVETEAEAQAWVTRHRARREPR